MFDGYLSLGGLEVLNEARVTAYVNANECTVGLIRTEPCEGLREALGDAAYTNIQNAPWYDAEDPTSWGFLGAYPISITGLSDSTRQATITEGILDGGVIQGFRRGVRQFRARVLLVAKDERALEYGMSWLDAMLGPGTCGTHGSMCGEVDAEFFVDCPPERAEGQSPEEYALVVDSYRRYLHDVAPISGPLILNRWHRENYHANEVEFTMAAGAPHVYGVTRSVEVPPSIPTLVQDSPINLVEYPSAELGEGTVAVATNFSPNPSLEANTTGWSDTGALGGGSMIRTSGRSNDLAAAGTYSYRSVIKGAAGSPAETGVEATPQIRASFIPIDSLPTTASFSFSVWAAAVVITGSVAQGTEILEVTADVVWEGGDGSMGDIYSITPMVGSGGVGGQVFTLANVTIPPPPVGWVANGAFIVISYRLKYTSSATPANNSEIRLYADAAAVTIP